MQFSIHCYSNGFGGFASQWLQAPNQSNLGRKSWTWSSWGKKSIFPWKSHAVQLARVSRKDVEILGIFFHFLHSHVPFLFFIFRNLPNPKLLVHGPKASYVSKRTQSSYDLPKARASYRRRDNVMSYVTSGGWEGFQFWFRGERERDREIEV